MSELIISTIILILLVLLFIILCSVVAVARKIDIANRRKLAEQAFDECYQSIRYTIDVVDGELVFNEPQFDMYKKEFLDSIK